MPNTRELPGPRDRHASVARIVTHRVEEGVEVAGHGVERRVVARLAVPGAVHVVGHDADPVQVLRQGWDVVACTTRSTTRVSDSTTLSSVVLRDPPSPGSVTCNLVVRFTPVSSMHHCRYVMCVLHKAPYRGSQTNRVRALLAHLLRIKEAGEIIELTTVTIFFLRM